MAELTKVKKNKYYKNRGTRTITVGTASRKLSCILEEQGGGDTTDLNESQNHDKKFESEDEEQMKNSEDSSSTSCSTASSSSSSSSEEDPSDLLEDQDAEDAFHSFLSELEVDVKEIEEQDDPDFSRRGRALEMKLRRLLSYNLNRRTSGARAARDKDSVCFFACHL